MESHRREVKVWRPSEHYRRTAGRSDDILEVRKERDDVRYNEDTLSKLLRIFFWGNTQKEVFDECLPKFTKKGVATGNPRFEFWRDYASKVYAEPAQDLKEKFGKFIFIPSSFGVANNILGEKQGLEISFQQSPNASELVKNVPRKQADQNLIAFNANIFNICIFDRF